MPIRKTDTVTYALLCFAEEGTERTDLEVDHTKLSDQIFKEVHEGDYTDVFIHSHGWKGDVAAAQDQYDRWFGAMEALAHDKKDMEARRPGFKQYRVGIHWPSLPWGDEQIGGGAAAFGPGQGLVDAYVQRLGDRPGLPEQIARVVKIAAEHPDAVVLPAAAVEAYKTIYGLMDEIHAEDAGSSPSRDWAPFDPVQRFNEAKTADPASFGFPGLNLILSPLRQLSFWKMKQRAQTIGSGGLNAFLKSLQAAVVGKDVRIHLMGHSFGCIVVSSMLTGADQGKSASPVASLALVQGALSLWSYSADIPVEKGTPGYFHRLLSQNLVKGPIITTRSKHDTALRVFYPLAAGVAGQVNYALPEYPRYGAVGAFGAGGLLPAATEVTMLAAAGNYSFVGSKGGLFNIEASQFIIGGDLAAGAHNEINGPEVAHAIWQAAFPAA